MRYPYELIKIPNTYTAREKFEQKIRYGLSYKLKRYENGGWSQNLYLPVVSNIFKTSVNCS